MPRRARAVAVVIVVVLTVVLIVAVAGVVGMRAWREAHRTDLQRAVAMTPAGVQRISFTDWAGVRRDLRSDVDADSPFGDVDDFLDQAFDRDLSSTSAMVDSTKILQEKFGVSPASVDWELFGQGSSGASVMLRMPDDTDFDTIADTLDELGYDRPEDDTGVWDGGEELVARISDGESLNPEFQYVALDAADHLVLTSDTASYLRVAVAAATGDGARLARLDPVVDATGDALSAAVYTGDNVCRALAMSQADESDQAQADALIAAAGEVNPMTGFAMAWLPDGDVRVAMSFEDAEQARVNADSRVRLAKGPAVGQGGDFADRFRVRRAGADGDVVTLDLVPEPDTYVLSDLSTGPVLFATC